MADFLAALGLVLVIEGVLCAALPRTMRRLAALAMERPPGLLRVAGVVSVAAGVFIVWLVRG